MKPIYVPTRTPEDWKSLLGDPELHWKDDRSAKSLALAWEAAAPGFPQEVRILLQASPNPALRGCRLLLALPEYQVPLPGGARPSQTDLLVLARGEQGLLVLAVEGKVAEPFGPTIGAKRAENSRGVDERLAYLLDLLKLPHDLPDTIMYQLLHRAASAILVARDFAAPHAVLLVHSFSSEHKWFGDFQAFTNLYGQRPDIGMLTELEEFGPTRLFAGWCHGLVPA